MKYILDASVAVKWVVPEVDSAKALGLRRDHTAGLHELLSPSTFAVEVAHALTRAERRGILAFGQAASRFQNVMTTAPLLQPFLSMLLRATDLSSKLRIGVYDCLYLALSEQEQCDVVTADIRLKGTGHPRVILLADLP